MDYRKDNHRRKKGAKRPEYTPFDCDGFLKQLQKEKSEGIVVEENNIPQKNKANKK